ncbi:IS481 family transposase [Spiractinospora alimapuensis]|uniref:IS481 family transposase n=1 Tax=Spiractinospora alimapuensis TaxID=2820884 RepID=UPI001F1EED27|nr:IS481 family transposase [Spiractinospora alimapuensis]QVQ51125.1 IS481 family transposase [Spiractinospora alimapuensis]QVQ51150.1 IS481 family transposase [Spiractinospora alimapuensis]QVQ52115.1 IS481 family transposase [Spiractinospora alimapuensis]QVQ52299.1 IS481 family transposase [Spiractinospora alimapuensis]
MPHATHPNAKLAPAGRLALARCIVEDGWPLRRAAERFQVSATTAQRWAARYRTGGPAAMTDASSRPARSPRRTSIRRQRRVIKLRHLNQWGPARIAGHLHMPASTVHRILTRHGCARLAHLDRATGRTVRRYERARPGELVHVDVKKLGSIPDGGGHRAVGRHAGVRNKQAATTARRNGSPVIGHSYLHTALDDHSRLAYTEILADERKETATAFWQRAAAYFASVGITVERVLTDNGSCYRSGLWRETLTQTQIAHKRTRPYRPQTNGKVERFHRTLTDEWAYARPYTSETQRRHAFTGWLHHYNHHRFHTAINGPPTTRVTNLTGQNT